MHAIRHHSFGPADVLRLEELPDLEPGPGELRIAVEAAGVHLIDTAIRSGGGFAGGPSPTLPVVPGREVAGVVDRVGEGVDDRLLGISVVAHLGPAGGGYAEQAVVAAERAYPVPAGIDAPTAVATIGTGRTAAAILELAAVVPEDVAAVTSGAGGLGLLLLQGVRNAGATAVGLAGGADKVALVAGTGAAGIDYRAADWRQRLRAHEPLTVVFDGVGGEIGRELYDALAPGGRLVRYGWASGEQNAYDDPGRPVLDVLGPGLFARIEHFERAALAAAADGTRVPHVGTLLPLERAADAHRALETRSSVGKVVLVVSR
ncbi:MAG TPA: zinc-binding dehydrogenase [Nocardioides sp.]|nr:zinc-binding dehydrogenase [Nocardioides sp.]